MGRFETPAGECYRPLLRFLFLPLEEPVDAEFIGKMSIGSKRHIPQIVEQFIVCSHCESVEDCSQLYVCPAADIHSDGIALFRRLLGMEPICSRKTPLFSLA